MTPDQMDAVYEQHWAAEAAGDVPAILETLTDDADHDVVGDPIGTVNGHAAIAERYGSLFGAIQEEKFETLRRYHGTDFLVDDSVWHGRVPGVFLGIPGQNRAVTFRILHVCEFRDGKISRENVWLDGGDVIQQLTAPA